MIHRGHVTALMLFMFFCVFWSSAEEGSPSSAGGIASGLESGLDASRRFSPFAAAWNPALGGFNPSANEQTDLYRIDTIIGFGGLPSLNGVSSFTAATGFGLPIDGGVITLSMDVLTREFGWITSALATYKRHFSSSLVLGAGLSAALNESARGGVQASLGAEWTAFPSPSSQIKLGTSLLGIGATIKSDAGKTPTLTFTPTFSLDTRFNLMSGPQLSTGIIVTAPGFMDIRSNIAVSAAFNDIWTIGIDWAFSVRDIESRFSSNSVAPFALPMIRVSFNPNKTAKLGIERVSLALHSTLSSMPFITSELTLSSPKSEPRKATITVHNLGTDYYSPRFYKLIPIGLTTSALSLIKEWGLAVLSPDHELVFSLPSTDSTSTKYDTNLPPERVEIPIATFRTDGSYTVRAWIKDRNDFVIRSEDIIFHIDSKAPSANISSDHIFTPNRDGINDLLTVKQSGSSEELWIGSIQNAAGENIKVLRWTDSAPIDFTWDGRNNDGNTVPDGKYRYVLHSTDSAENFVQARLEEIIVDTVSPSLSVNLSSDYYAAVPNSADLIATIAIMPKEDISNWRIMLESESGLVQREWLGSSDNLDLVPDTIIFDGRTKEGDTVPDGSYRFAADFLYLNGNRTKAFSSFFQIDSKRPSGRVRADHMSIAIGSNENIVFYHDLSPNATWNGLVMDDEGKVVYKNELDQGSEAITVWSGIDSNGGMVPAGIYHYKAVGTGRGGQYGETDSVKIELTQTGDAILLSAEKNAFSIKVGDGRIVFRPSLEGGVRPLNWRLELRYEQSGNIIRTISGIAPLPAIVPWEGINDQGFPANDGEYLATIHVNFDNGEYLKSTAFRFILDSTKPKADVSLSKLLFSPNDDGVLDTIAIEQTLEPGLIWNGVIINAVDRVIKKMTWFGSAPNSVVWDGRDDKGNAVENGGYRYRVFSEDKAGNFSQVESAEFKLDARVASIQVDMDKIAFSPNGDNFVDTIGSRIHLGFTDGIRSISAKVISQDGDKVKNFIITSIDEIIYWDGLSDSQKRVPDGRYRIQASVEYEKGDHVSALSADFILDTTAPNVDFTISPLPFSPDGDGYNDELCFVLKIEEEYSVPAWSLVINDPEGQPFAAFSSDSPPEKAFYWDGRDIEGNLVEAAQDYSFSLKVRDALGNTTSQYGVIPVDVFVINEDGKLKIRISSIHFAPNKADLFTGDTTTDKKNASILDRVAETLGKFPQYRVRIEGHAVNLSNTEQEERAELEPLSLSRAESVLQALVERGIDQARLEAWGRGGREPIVPHYDTDTRWKNRRVEFILLRQ